MDHEAKVPLGGTTRPHVTGPIYLIIFLVASGETPSAANRRRHQLLRPWFRQLMIWMRRDLTEPTAK